MDIKDIVGAFRFKGKNQDATSEYTYSGNLTLKLNADNRIDAIWQIGTDYQYGVGFFKNDILVVNFHYQGEDDVVYKGVAVYRCIDKNTLDGFWSEKHGDPNYLGEELCTRLLGDGYLN